MASVIPLVPAWRVDRPFDYAVPEKLAGSIVPGSLVRIPFGHRRVRGIVVDIGEGAGGELETIAGLVFPEPVAAPPMPEVLDWIATRYTTPRGRVYARVVPTRVRVKAESSPHPVAIRPPTIVPTYEGGAALLDALRTGKPGTWCFRTQPGEDRGTLIAELVAAAASSDGGSSLVAVPEVRYGSLVLDALEEAFPGLARVDSSQEDAERSRAWLALARGAGVGAGGRSVVFAPAPALRALIVDEEHHRSYKEDRSPRYNARLVAMQRARVAGAVCVLLSSTPSLDTGWRAAEGTFHDVVPTRERAREARPIVELVERGDGALSPELHRAMRDTLRAGGRVGLLVPQSGYARAIWCASCRRSLRCARCEAGLIYERSELVVRCPRCGLKERVPDVCPSCGGHDFRLLGAGSERLRDQLAKAFPRSRVRRVDPQVMATGDPRPSGPEADVYVTTWIGTKEVLRPQVDLVGVLSVDALIRRPDYRAAEDAYQTLAEMAEWAGPRTSGGRLVIQTAEPAHHAVQAVTRGDYPFFLEREVEQRRELGYPPFSELVKVRASGPAGTELLEKVRTIARSTGAQILGPVPVREAGSGVVAAEVLLKCRDATSVASMLRDILPSVPSGSRLRVEADPR